MISQMLHKEIVLALLAVHIPAVYYSIEVITNAHHLPYT